MWGYLYPDTDATGTVRGLATPTPPQAKGEGFAAAARLEVSIPDGCCVLGTLPPVTAHLR